MTNPADPDCCCGLSEPAAVVLHQDETAVSLAVRGEIDMDNAGHLSHLIGAVLARRPRFVAIDAAGITFLGAAGIQALLKQRAQAARLGCRLVIRRPHPAVQQVLQASGDLAAFDLPLAAPASWLESFCQRIG